jgi:hypothetical protein
MKSELIALLQKEVRVLLHLVGKIDAAMLDYRPTPKQRSTIELLQYLTNMGPTLVLYAKGQPLDAAAMAEAIEVASARDFDETVLALAAHTDVYVELLADMSDQDFRAETTGFDGLPVFSPDGKYLMWSSKRTKDKTTQVFVAKIKLPRGS